MQEYSFCVRNGAPPTPDSVSILPNAEAAQNLALTICADLARGIVCHLTGESGRQVTVSDDTGRAFYRISVVAKSLE